MKLFQRLLVVLALVVVMASPVLADVAKNKPSPGPADTVETLAPNTSVLSGGAIGAGIGVALAILGAGLGFGKIGAAALESMARQPEVAARIQTAAIIIGALLEGATFFGLLVCILIQGKATF